MTHCQGTNRRACTPILVGRSGTTSDRPAINPSQPAAATSAAERIGINALLRTSPAR
jgi:hypothetical protein